MAPHPGKPSNRLGFFACCGCNRNAATQVYEPQTARPPAEEEIILDVKPEWPEPVVPGPLRQAPVTIPTHPGRKPETQQSTKLTGDWDVPEPSPDDGDWKPQTPVETKDAKTVQRKTALAETILHFQSAVHDHDNGEVHELSKKHLISGFSAYAAALNALGGDMGTYLTTNIVKLENSKADKNLAGYREWLRSELPVQLAAGGKGYTDESAWMGNLWLGWTMEFFVGMMSEMHAGAETANAVDVAYKKTLSNHHNWFQRSAFQVAMKKLPGRADVLKKLKGQEIAMSEAELMEDLGSFVKVGRTVVAFLLKVNDELDQLLKDSRTKK